MQVLRRRIQLLPGLVLAGFLFVAQLWAMAHAFEHDPGAPSLGACASCVTAAQLAAAAVTTPATIDLLHSLPVAAPVGAWSPTHSDRHTPHQRGPPRHRPDR